MLEQLIKILLIIKMAASLNHCPYSPPPPCLPSFLTWLGKSKDLGNKLAVALARTLVSLTGTVGGPGMGKRGKRGKGSASS